MPPPAHQPISGPHSVSLKVLRLSRPSLATSHVLPKVDKHPNLQTASLAYPTQPPDAFPLTPLLTLPPSFGAAYVGEQFACTLCANRERTTAEDAEIRIEEVSIKAELQSPSTAPQGIALELERAPLDPNNGDEAHTSTLESIGQSIQGMVRHDLAEEGTHVLAVTVSYTEIRENEEKRTRSFRKLYQFVAQQAIGVRSKVGEMARRSASAKGKTFALEAQIENLTDQNVLLDLVTLALGKGLKSRDLNGEKENKVLLKPLDVEQVAFLLEQEGEEELEEDKGRYVLAQLTVDWRLAMGQDGTLKTGWLGCRKR